jgi:tetratricopeptide (TPR) repeat protein
MDARKNSLRRNSPWIALALGVATALTAPKARAQPVTQMARADALWTAGRSLREGGHLAEACADFAQSNELVPRVAVGLDLADCFERMGKTTSAWLALDRAEKLARARHDPRADEASSRAKALRARLTVLTITVSAATAADIAQILLDEQAVPGADYNKALAVDPGHHVVVLMPRSGPRRILDVNVPPGSAPVRVHAEDARAEVAPIPAGSIPPAPAEALFEEGKRLRDAGRVEEACSKFAQSRTLVPGIGVTLHLADCYERLGRTASAWTEFTLAEKAAHDAADNREATAHARAAALEPKLERITIAVAPSTPRDHALVQLDGRTLAPSMWGAAIPSDPGDHLVAFEAPGVERKTFPAHLDESTPAVTVQVGVAAEPPPAAAATPASAPALETSPGSPGSVDRREVTRRWWEIGLLGGGLVAAGVGAGLLVVKNDSMSNTAAAGRPYVDPVAAAASKIAFATAGAAGAAAVVIYLTAPSSRDAGLYVRPSTTVGGCGASIGGAF